MSIEWDKVLDKPEKNYKVTGETLLEFRKRIEILEDEKSKISKEQSNLSDKVTSLEQQVSSLETTIKEKTATIASLEGKLTDLNSSMDSKDNLVAKLEEELTSKANNITTLEKALSDQKAENTQLHDKTAALEDQIASKQVEIDGIKQEMSQQLDQLNNKLVQQTEQYKTDVNTLNNKITELQGLVDLKEKALQEKDGQIGILNGQIETLNTKIEELKEQIPKKPVYEDADEVVKGSGCPKCGWTTIEEYKIVDGKKHLIRKYCPNTFCMWTSTEGHAIKISDEMPETETEVLKVFNIVKGELVETPTVNTTMVAIISDPDQNTVWIWKGEDSSRFEYAEATTLATKVKNDILKKPTANITRVNEGAEPDNFPNIK